MASRVDPDGAERMRGVLAEQAADALAVIAPQAATAEALVLADGGSEAALRAIAVVQRSAEDALDALRRLLPVLPERGPSPYAPQPGLADVHLEAARRGPDGPVRFALVRDLGRVPAGVQLVLHHALMAGLALADRSGGGAVVRLRRRAEAVVLHVVLTDPVDPEDELEGVRARAALYGGAVRWSAGRRLTVTLPMEVAG